MKRSLKVIELADHEHIEKFILDVAKPRNKRKKPASEEKLRKYATAIFCGLSIGYYFNKTIKRRTLKDVRAACANF
jgi:hypothetical protein